MGLMFCQFHFLFVSLQQKYKLKMARKDQISTAGALYVSKNWKTDIPSVLIECFEKGADWADAHPLPYTADAHPLHSTEEDKEKSPWISVEDDLPCNHEELLTSPKSYRTKSVIVRFDDNMRAFMYMVKIPNKWRWKWHTAKITGITHWMPIPELSKD